MFNFILFCSVILVLVAFCFWLYTRNYKIWKRFWHQIHLWLGIVSGIVLFVVCFSGMLLVFRWEIINLFEYDKYSVSHHGLSPLNINDMVAKVEQNMNGKISTIYTENRHNNTKAYTVSIKINNNESLEVKNKFCLIDPYTGQILEDNFSPLVILFMIVTKLHTSLFLPNPIGKILVGSATFIFVIMVFSGLCLWLPANFRNIKSWKNNFIIRLHKGKILFLNDLHKTLGFYALIPILLMALTGLMLSFQWFNNSVQTIFRAEPDIYIPVKSSPKNPNTKQLPLDFFDKKVDEMLKSNKGGHRRIYLPAQEDDPVMIKEWHQKILDGYDRIQFDQYTGEMLQIERFKDKSIGTKIVSLLTHIHDGEILGLPTKIIYFLACLIATTLPITGTIIWLRKLRHLRKTKNKTNDKLNAA